MSPKFWLIAMLALVAGVAGHFLVEDWKKAIGFIVVASCLDIFWDLVLTAWEKREGEID